MHVPVLSRNDIEQIARKILAIYTEAYVPQKHLFYQVVPEDLAEVLGLDVDYQILSPDGTILGVTAPNEQYVSVFYDRDAAYKLCRSGLFRVVKVGKTVRISKKSFDAWLEENA